MHALQMGIAALASFEEPVTFGSAEDFERAWIRTVAMTPVIVAEFERHRRGLEPLESDPSLNTAANFLWLLNGEKPAAIAEKTLDVALILHADHTMNASTFAARVVYGTNAGPYDSISAAVGALHGPLHGGANERVLAALESIGELSNVRPWAEDKFENKGKIMGFGHRVYSVKDPRSYALQALSKELFAELGTTPLYEVALALEDIVTERLGDKGIYPNVDFFSGIVYRKLGIPTDQFTPIFAIARVSGWLAHLREQMNDNKLFRPGQIYVGHRERSWPQ
jgi:citrate synthase